MTSLSPAERLARYGPTTGDRVRLGDTDLWVRVEDDRQAPGDPQEDANALLNLHSDPTGTL